jgi:RHH-type proline utilization regulon transcriptional repressor/proline dehydrogenase/delta 1-pyrroline-5-carboxylate dehydrogenase
VAQRRSTPLVAEPYERDVIRIAREIGELGGGAKARAYEISHLTELMMTLAMRLPEFQTQLFRFVDVFPAMGDARDTTRHLAEYFDTSHVPPLIGAGVRAASHVPGGPSLVAKTARREVTNMARQFIVGSDPAEAAEELGRMWRGGTAATIDLLGEHTFSHSESDAYADRLASVITTLLDASETWPANPLLESDDLGPLGRVAVSIKPSALAPDFAPLTAEAGIETAKRRLRPILASAAARRAQVWFDMERYDAKHLTYRLFRELLEEPELSELQAGIVVQAYLKDSFEDLGRLLDWAGSRPVPISVRLVKGAYWDTETIVAKAAGWEVPVYEQKAETDLNYELCTRALLAAHGKVRAAFATHNFRSLAYALAAARHAGIPDHGFEVQLLYGMAEPVHEAVRQRGLRLRVYAPIGELVPGMAYLVRRLLENTSNESFVRRRFAEGKGLDVLLTKPKVEKRPTQLVAVASGPPGDYRPEPVSEWHKAEVRDAMSSALGRRLDSLGQFVPGLIAGHDAQTNRVIQSVNPADPASIVATSACCGPFEVTQAVEAASSAFETWSRRAGGERAEVLFEAARWMRERRFEIAALEVVEAGKGWADADGDVCEAIDYLEYYGRQAVELAKGGAVQSPPGEVNRLSYQGRGVTAVIAPWNFPLAIPTGMTSAALVAGNAVILKPAEQTPAIARVLVDALRAGGAPPGTVSFLPGYGEEIGEVLVSHPDIVTVAFTGSKAVGLHINEVAARTVEGQREVRRVLAEMGGKNAIVVDSDADLDVAVPAAVRSAFGFAGQRCSAASRIVVVEPVHDAFLERFVEAARALAIGDPAVMGTEMGPVIDEDALKRISDWQERAAQFGKVALQREDLPERGYFVGPTVVDGVDPLSPLATEEIFGPVAAVMVAPDFDKAIEMANTGQYALTAGLISRSPSHIVAGSERLRAGNVYINREIVGAVVGRQPFGGHAMSGFGQKAGGPDYLLQFMQPRVVTENTLRQGFAPLT